MARIPCRVPEDAALIALLGALAYASSPRSTGWPRIPGWAPTLAGRAALAQMRRRDRTTGCWPSGSPRSAWCRKSNDAVSSRALDGFHATTVPADWLEGLVKAYVGDGLAADFLPRGRRFRDPATAS